MGTAEPVQVTATDEELAAWARQGNQDAFAAIYRRHVGAVHRRLCGLAGPGEQVRDLVQQTFLELHRSLPQYRGECRLKTWLTRITIHVASQHRRTARRRPLELGVEPADHLVQAPTQGQGLAAQEAWRLLQELPDKLRTPLVLREVEEMTLDEIATTLGASLSTVASRIDKARAVIAKQLRRRGR